jgi:hypothetical protein
MALPRELGTEPAAMWTFGGLDLAEHGVLVFAHSAGNHCGRVANCKSQAIRLSLRPPPALFSWTIRPGSSTKLNGNLTEISGEFRSCLGRTIYIADVPANNILEDTWAVAVAPDGTLIERFGDVGPEEAYRLVARRGREIAHPGRPRVPRCTGRPWR